MLLQHLQHYVMIVSLIDLDCVIYKYQTGALMTACDSPTGVISD